MKTDRGIQPVVVAVGGVDRFRTAHLFGRLTEKTQRAGDAMRFHGLLGSQKARKGSQTEGGMGIGVTGGMFRRPWSWRAVRGGDLGLAGHRIVFSIAADDRPVAVRPGCTEGRRHARRPLLDFEPLLAESVNVPL